MNCPKCGSKTKVLDTRDSDQFETCWWRRRQCLNCKHKFTTYEILPEVLIEAKNAKNKLHKIGTILGVEE